MPVVPRADGFRVTLNESGGIRPMGFETPNVPDTSKDIQKGIDNALGAINRYIKDQDDARVTDALTKLRRHAIDAESGENGYRKLQGENALLPDDEGKGLVDRVDTDMHTFGDSLTETMNARQRRLFQERAQPIYIASYGSVSQHVHDQGVSYAQNSAIAAIDQYIESGATYAGRPDYMAQNRDGIVEQVERLAELRGYSDEQKDNLMRKSMSGMYTNAINAVMSNADQNPAVAYQAQAILQNHSREMLASDVVRAKTQINRALEILNKSKSIEEFLRRGDEVRGEIAGQYVNLLEKGEGNKEARAAVEGYHYGILPEVSAGGHQSLITTTGADGRELPDAERRYGGSQMTVGDARETAEAHGMIFDRDRFVKDRGYNVSLGMYRYSDLLKNYAGDQTMTMASWFSSDETVKKAAEDAAKAGTPVAWFSFLPKDVQEKVERAQRRMSESTEVRDAYGNKISSFSPEYAARLPRWQTAEQAREFFRANDARAAVNPAYCEELVNGAMARVNQQKASYAQDQANKMATVLEQLWQNGGDMSAIPQSMLDGLDLNQISDLQTKAQKIAINEQVSDPYVLSKLMDDNGYLLSLSADQLKMYGMGSLSRDDYQKVLYRRSKLEQQQIQANDFERMNIRGSQMGQINSDFVPSSEHVEAALKEDPSYLKLKENHPEAAMMLRAELVNRLTADAMRSNIQYKDQATVRQQILNYARDYVTIDGWFSDTKKPAFMMQLDDLPNKGVSDARNVIKEIAKQELIRVGITDREPTELEQQRALTYVLLNRGNTSTLAIPELDDSLARKIEADYTARYHARGGASPGYTMPRNLKLRAWLIARASGQVAEEGDTNATIDNIYASFDDTVLDDDEYLYGLEGVVRND